MTHPFHVYAPYLSFAGFSDIYLEESSALSLQWEGGQVETLSKSQQSGLGLRLMKGTETRYGYTNLSNPLSGKPTAVEKKKVQALLDSLKGGCEKKSIPSLKPVQCLSHPLIKDPTTVPLKDKMTLLETVYHASQIDKRITQVMVKYGEKLKKIGYVNSDGTCFREERMYLVMAVQVTAEEGNELQNAYETLGGISGFEIFNDQSGEKLAKTVAERAVKKLTAPKAPVGEMPVVIASEAGGTLIHEAIGHSLEADAVLEGTSPAYHNRIGEKVANENLTVFDDPTVPGKRGSFFFDDEGTRSEPSKLIDRGILKDYMFDRLSSIRAKRQSNGHGRRESYEFRPIPRMSNTFVAPGQDDPKDIIQSIKNGFLVTRMGGGQVNTTNGDFVFEVEEGFKVEDGKRTFVRGATLLGNGPQVLLDIDRVGTDQGWGIGTCGKEGQGVPVSDALPTIRIKKLVIGGQG